MPRFRFSCSGQNLATDHDCNFLKNSQNHTQEETLRREKEELAEKMRNENEAHAIEMQRLRAKVRASLYSGSYIIAGYRRASFP